MKDIQFPEPKLDGNKVGYAVKRFRDAHHRVARLYAIGVRPIERLAVQTGYSVVRIHTLLADPGFKELIEHYRGEAYKSFQDAADPFIELAAENMLKAETMISEKLDEAIESGEMLPTRDLLAISRDSADRLGYGKKQTNLNVNVDFAAQLEAAIRRSRDPKVVELKPVHAPEPQAAQTELRDAPATAPASPNPPFRRRA